MASSTTIAAVLMVALLVATTCRLAEGQTDCAAKLVPCAEYLNSTNPSAECCSAMKQVVETQLSCLCGLIKNPALLGGLNITQALELPKHCNLPSDTFACNTGPKPHQSMAALGHEYGPLVHLKMGLVHVVVAASARVAEQFLKVHDANFSSRPPNVGAKYVAYNYQDLVYGPYGPRWQLLRKISTVHIFSAKALDDFRCGINLDLFI